MPTPRGNGGLVAMLLTCCALVLGTSASSPRILQQWHWLQLLGVAALSSYWLRVTLYLNACTAHEKQQQHERLDCAADLQKIKGLDRKWWLACDQVLSQLKVGGGAVLAGGFAVLLVSAYPSSVFDMARMQLQSFWTHLVAHYNPLELWLGTTCGLHLAIFWPVGLLSATLELWRPACLEPFKCQQEERLTVKMLCKAIAVALVNQALLALTCIGIYYYFAPLHATAFGTQLPSLQEVLVHLACCIVVSELLFYAGHRLLHVPWVYRHIHYVHHAWSAPIAIASIYAHPLEFLLANIPVIAFGPMLMQSHLSVYMVWVMAATWKILSGHLGWNLPLIGSPDAHDFHHSFQHGDNLNNLGQIGVLDAFYATNRDWLESWQARVPGGTYTSPDYPVDKAIVMPKTVASA